MRNWRWRKRSSPRNDALQPVPVVFKAVRELHRHAVGIEKFFVTRVKPLQGARAFGVAGGGGLVAADEYPTLVADELDAVLKFVGNGKANISGIDQLHSVRAMNIPDFVRGKFSLAFYFSRAAQFQVHSPVRRVKMVCAPA